MHIKDPFGNEKEYTPEKIIDSVMRSGFSRDEAEEIEERVRERVEDGIKSKELYVIVYQEMQKVNEAYALRYRLREAIGVLDPNDHEFEKYMCKVLSQEGFDTEWSPRPLPQGSCSTHEIDVLAEKNGTIHAVECKHHFHYHRLTGMDVPMLQWAVMEDLQQGHEQGLEHAIDVDEPWVVVNTKLSQHAKKYAECKGIRMTAWDYPNENSLREIVERNTAYPVTILRLSPHKKEALSRHDVITLHELLNLDPHTDQVDLSSDDIRDLQQRAEKLIDGN